MDKKYFEKLLTFCVDKNILIVRTKSRTSRRKKG
nr:MAG TPA: hypothetical protein [Caudoviricetes sp.]